VTQDQPNKKGKRDKKKIIYHLILGLHERQGQLKCKNGHKKSGCWNRDGERDPKKGNNKNEEII
jgi:hypothetical protein